MLHDGYILAGLGCAVAGFAAVVYVLFVAPWREERRLQREFNKLWGNYHRAIR